LLLEQIAVGSAQRERKYCGHSATCASLIAKKRREGGDGCGNGGGDDRSDGDNDGSGAVAQLVVKWCEQGSRRCE
jgi:hypothetical protein